jgi:hypothetical protein
MIIKPCSTCALAIENTGVYCQECENVHKPFDDFFIDLPKGLDILTIESQCLNNTNAGQVSINYVIGANYGMTTVIPFNNGAEYIKIINYLEDYRKNNDPK